MLTTALSHGDDVNRTISNVSNAHQEIISGELITVSKRTLQNHIRRITQLYEQKKHLPNWKMLLDDYRQNWVAWVYSGIPSSIINFDYEPSDLNSFLTT